MNAASRAKDFGLLAATLSEALDLVEQVVADPAADAEAARSLLQTPVMQRCLDLCQQPPDGLPEPVRTVHHLACSGGTLISRCIAAMPNVQLLSEIDPLAPGPGAAGKPRFAPTDMATLLRQSTRGVSQPLLIDLFHAELRVILLDATSRGQRLVLRDHAHSQFCREAELVDGRPDLKRIVQAAFPVRSVVTVRHPVDSFASLQANGWVHFTPATFDEYCRRYLCFLVAMGDTPVVRYEDFVRAPQDAMRGICTVLDLPFNESFEDVFSTFTITGDSGRSGQRIGPRPRRSDAVALFDTNSQHFGEVAQRLGYDTEHKPE